MLKRLALSMVAGTLMLGACEGPLPLRAPGAPAAQATALRNIHVPAPGLITGSGPQGDAAFDELAALGVRTIISVDGARPEVERARARGMRYVHLPLGYDRIPPEREARLARALRDLPGPIYLHCHHGLHRGPAAAAAALVALGRLTPDEGVAFMKRAGTSDHYAGLYECVRASGPLTARTIDAASPDFPETAEVSGMVSSMVAIDHAFDRLDRIRSAGWRTPANHPDLVPAAEAGMLADLLRSVRDDPESREHPAEFHAILDAAARWARAMEDAIVAGSDPGPAFQALDASCRDCHGRFRDH